MANTEIELLKPTVEQIDGYYDTMLSIVRSLGKYVRHGHPDDRASTRVGTEYLLPGSHTEWSEPDRKYRTHVEHDRCYSLSARGLGQAAGKLCILEYETTRLPDGLLHTNRGLYRFMWDEPSELTQAEYIPIEIISSEPTSFEVFKSKRITLDDDGVEVRDGDIFFMDHEESIVAQTEAEIERMAAAIESGVDTIESQELIRYERYFNPFRTTQSPWSPVSREEFAALHERTLAYGDAITANSKNR